jgi:hypothetical protein
MVNKEKSGMLMAKYGAGFLCLCIYLHINKYGIKYYDIVLFRRIKTKKGTTQLCRGANLKPSDLVNAITLYQEAQKFLLEKNCAN